MVRLPWSKPDLDNAKIEGPYNFRVIDTHGREGQPSNPTTLVNSNASSPRRYFHEQVRERVSTGRRQTDPAVSRTSSLQRRNALRISDSRVPSVVSTLSNDYDDIDQKPAGDPIYDNIESIRHRREKLTSLHCATTARKFSSESLDENICSTRPPIPSPRSASYESENVRNFTKVFRRKSSTVYQRVDSIVSSIAESEVEDELHSSIVESEQDLLPTSSSSDFSSIVEDPEPSSSSSIVNRDYMTFVSPSDEKHDHPEDPVRPVPKPRTRRPESVDTEEKCSLSSQYSVTDTISTSIEGLNVPKNQRKTTSFDVNASPESLVFLGRFMMQAVQNCVLNSKEFKDASQTIIQIIQVNANQTNPPLKRERSTTM